MENSIAKELYEKHKGRLAYRDGRLGKVCGYGYAEDYVSLIMAIFTDSPAGWNSTTFDNTIVTNRNNKNGYYWVTKDDVLPMRKSLLYRLKTIFK